jgi:hypothetical protein
MGNCVSNTDKSRKNHSLEQIPEIHYLNRLTGKVHYITNRKTTRINLKPVTKFPFDSAIGYLSEKQKIFIVGGSRKLEFLSLAYVIDLKLFTVQTINSLPVPSKEGQVHQLGEWVYYVGALRKDGSELVTAPIIRYSLKQEFWQEIMEPEGEVEKFKFNSLIHFGSCLSGNRILIIGGQRRSKLGNLKCNKTIFSFSFENGFLIEAVGKIPMKILRPVIAGGDKHGIVIGGKNPKNNEMSKSCYYFTIKDKNIKFHGLDPLSFPIEENYPPVYNREFAMFISFPMVVIRFRNKINWSVYQLRNKLQKNTVALPNKSIAQSKILSKNEENKKSKLVEKPDPPKSIVSQNDLSAESIIINEKKPSRLFTEDKMRTLSIISSIESDDKDISVSFNSNTKSKPSISKLQGNSKPSLKISTQNLKVLDLSFKRRSTYNDNDIYKSLNLDIQVPNGGGPLIRKELTIQPKFKSKYNLIISTEDDQILSETKIRAPMSERSRRNSSPLKFTLPRKISPPLVLQNPLVPLYSSSSSSSSDSSSSSILEELNEPKKNNAEASFKSSAKDSIRARNSLKNTENEEHQPVEEYLRIKTLSSGSSKISNCRSLSDLSSC